jgi:ATP-dependent Clp protease ATP-binding subunit ClpX
MDMEGVKLKFTDGSIKAISREAGRRKTGARGLRAVLEEVMLDSMYELPGMSGVTECIVNEEVIVRREIPLFLYEKQDEKQAS